MVGLERFVDCFFPKALCSWDRSGEDTGSKEEMGAFLSTGEGDRDFKNGEEGREPAADEVVGEEETLIAEPATENGTGGFVSISPSSVSTSFVGLGIGTIGAWCWGFLDDSKVGEVPVKHASIERSLVILWRRSMGAPLFSDMPTPSCRR